MSIFPSLTCKFGFKGLVSLCRLSLSSPKDIPLSPRAPPPTSCLFHIHRLPPHQCPWALYLCDSVWPQTSWGPPMQSPASASHKVPCLSVKTQFLRLGSVCSPHTQSPGTRHRALVTRAFTKCLLSDGRVRDYPGECPDDTTYTCRTGNWRLNTQTQTSLLFWGHSLAPDFLLQAEALRLLQRASCSL